MPSLNVFDSDAFSMTSLTKSVNEAPRLSTKLGDLGLFNRNGLRTTSMWIERRHGDLKLIHTSPRGAPSEQLLGDKRDALKFTTPHVSLESTVFAAEVQDQRRFGAESDLETVQNTVNERQAAMRRRVEITWENLRVGALRGEIRDADGGVLYNLYDEFGRTQTEQTFEFSDASAKIRNTCLDVHRSVEDALGAQNHDGVIALCGSNFFDELISHPDVRESYARYQDGEYLRNDPRRGFPFANILFIEYRAQADGKPFLGADECYAAPTGTDSFIERYSPADFWDVANDIGAPLYSRLALDPEFQRYARLHMQSNPLMLNTRPDAVVKINPQ